MTPTLPFAAAPHLAESDFRRLSEFIYRQAGIALSPAKLTMVETRLRKRLTALDMPSYREYCDYVLGPRGSEEWTALFDRITTNKTDFFRESVHFRILTQTALPVLASQYEAGLRQPLAVWSAGCSSGEEPYTLAMVLSEHAAAQPGARYRFGITATDLSTHVLDKAKQAVYAAELVEPVPQPMRHKYLLRSRDASQGLVRICPELRALVTFKRLNLMDGSFGFTTPFDVIFCRNVMIYFDKATQEALVNRFATNLRRGGYLFIGHSETLNGLSTPFVPLAPAVYRKPA